MLAFPKPFWRWAGFKPPRAPSAFRLHSSRSGKQTISLLHLRHSTAEQTRFTSWTTLSLLPIARASSHLRWERDCQPSSIIEVLLKSEVCCPTDQTSRTCSDERLTWSTKFCMARKPANIPVEQPTKFDLVINLTTAKTLGLSIPDKLLA